MNNISNTKKKVKDIPKEKIDQKNRYITYTEINCTGLRQQPQRVLQSLPYLRRVLRRKKVEPLLPPTVMVVR